MREMAHWGERNRRWYFTNTCDVTDHECLEAADATLQNPVDLATVGKPLQVHSNGRQVDLVLLQSLAAATVQLDGPLR